MGRRGVILLLPALLLLLPAGGCSKHSAPLVVADLGQEFTLSVGESAVIGVEGLHLTFAEVVSDSRCPQGATCIWAGEVSCLLQVTDAESTYDKVLTQPGGASTSGDAFACYEVTFDVEPYPQLGTEIQAEDYRLHLTVNPAAQQGG
jgi:hypothetical protein